MRDQTLTALKTIHLLVRKLVEVELSRIREFFVSGGADAYMEFLERIDLSGVDLWERLTSSKRGEFTSFIAL